jgi:hypothetical protein
VFSLVTTLRDKGLRDAILSINFESDSLFGDFAMSRKGCGPAASTGNCIHSLVLGVARAGVHMAKVQGDPWARDGIVQEQQCRTATRSGQHGLAPFAHGVQRKGLCSVIRFRASPLVLPKHPKWVLEGPSQAF